MDKVYLNKRTLELLKSLLKRKGSEIEVSECYYMEYSKEFQELKNTSLIKLSRLDDDQIKGGIKRYYKITKDGVNYFKHKRNVKWKYWIPILINSILSIVAIIISIIK